MIDRLNFYDVYGYLVPGLVLVGALWLPFQLATAVPLPPQWASAFFAALLGYVAGHLLQILAEKALPHERPVGGGARRRFSSLLLDEKESTLSDALRTSVKQRIRTNFALDVDGGDLATLEQRRLDAFMLCRAALVQKKAAAYAEQFQGMYALMRGLTATAIFSIAYLLGWLLARFVPAPEKPGRVGIALVAFVLLVLAGYVTDRRLAFRLIGLALLVAGLLCGIVWSLGDRPFFVLLGGWGVAYFAARKCHAAYLEFAKSFAATVYRDFVRLPEAESGGARDS